MGYETLGGFGVAVFFVISGFLVTASWERGPRVGTFARKRALRILPAYAAVITACALILGPALTQLPLGEYFHHRQTWDYFRNLTFVQLRYSLPGVFVENPYPHVVNGSIWTLPIELAMYVVLALLGRAGMLTRFGVTTLVAVLAVVWLGWSGSLREAPALGTAALPVAYTVHLAFWFFSGSALWLWRDRVVYRLDVVAALYGAAWLVRGGVAGDLLFHVTLPYLLIWAAMLPAPWMNRFGHHGDFSYGMYLWAFPVQQAFAQFATGAWGQPAYIVACFAVTLACAVLSWHAVERPALQRKTRQSGSGRAAAVAPRP